jgi:hypothetical protein
MAGPTRQDLEVSLPVREKAVDFQRIVTGLAIGRHQLMVGTPEVLG